jgi:uncharacterized phage protein (TIGR01671 family)
MRPLIFRGKDEKTKAWHQGGFTLDAAGHPRIITVSKDGEGLEFNKVIPETVGQYTGRDDINKTKIFEGDITKSSHKKVINDDVSWSNSDKIEPPKIIETVYFNQIDWFDGVKVSGWRIRGGRFQAQLKGSTVHNMKLEVVGKIHDNPELILPQCKK